PLYLSLFCILFAIANISIATFVITYLSWSTICFGERTRAMRPDETLGYWLKQTMQSVANAFADVLQTACATLGKPYVITPPQWFALSSLACEQDLLIGTLA